MKIIYFLVLVLLVGCTKNRLNTNESTNIETTTKPNILLILIDDLGSETLSINGGQSYSMPNLDEIASKSLWFTNCNSTPLCATSRVQLLTGKMNFRNYERWGELNHSNYTLGNMMKNAGYATGFFGKWQLNSGHESMSAFGFDKYILHDAFGATQRGSRYKSPLLYTNEEFLPRDSTRFKYGEDIVRDSLLNFVNKNKETNKSWFAYYSMLLCHEPFQPTPDDEEYNRWSTSESDTKWYPNMVKYMDKTIGKVVNHLDSLGIAENTIVIITSDNGTPSTITSISNDKSIAGGKGRTTKYGTNIPLFVFWKGKNKIGIDNSLINFSDFMPTIAEATNSSVDDFTDGISFYKNIIGQVRDVERQYIYFDFSPKTGKLDDSVAKHSIWVMDKKYKLYDSTVNPFEFRQGRFYKYKSKPMEGKNNHIEYTEMTNYEKNRYKYFKDILDSIKSTY